MKLLKKKCLCAVMAALVPAFAATSLCADEGKAPKPAAPAPAAAPAKALSLEERFSFLPDVVAEIGDRKISKKEFIDEIKGQFPPDRFPEIPEERLKELSKKMVEGMLDKIILLSLVAKDGVKPSPELVKEEFDKMLKSLPAEQAEMMKKQLEFQGKTLDSYKEELSKDKNAQEGLALNKWIEKNLVPKVAVADADVEKYYREHQEEFKTPESVTASHILITPKVTDDPKATPEAKSKAAEDADKAALKKATDILAKLKQGASFEETAEKESDCPSGKNAKGSLGEFGRDGQMVKEFEDAAFALEPGQMSDVVKTQFGYHIIKLSAKKPAGYVPLDTVKSYIKETLSKQGVMDVLQKTLQQEKEKQKAKLDI